MFKKIQRIITSILLVIMITITFTLLMSTIFILAGVINLDAFATRFGTDTATTVATFIASTFFFFMITMFALVTLDHNLDTDRATN